MFKFICIEGADRTGKTTLSNYITQNLDNVNYWHFTGCNKTEYKTSDVVLQLNVNVMYQFYRFFNDHFYNNKVDLTNTTYLLDRTLYSDIVYGPIFRGVNDELVVRRIESNFFTMMLQGLGCIFIFADNSEQENAFSELEKENEGFFKSQREYNLLRSTYRLVIQHALANSDLQDTVLHYDFNKTTTENFVNDILTPLVKRPNPILDTLVENRALGQMIGTTNITKDTEIIRIPGDRHAPITLQDYANLIVDTGMDDLAKDSPLMADNRYCIVRQASTADWFITGTKNAAMK